MPGGNEFALLTKWLVVRAGPANKSAVSNVPIQYIIMYKHEDDIETSQARVTASYSTCRDLATRGRYRAAKIYAGTSTIKGKGQKQPTYLHKMVRRVQV